MKDPRTLLPAPPAHGDIRPTVAVRQSDLSVWLFGGGMVIAALLLFIALEVRRKGDVAPVVQQRRAEIRTTASLPELYVPEPEPAYAAPYRARPQAAYPQRPAIPSYRPVVVNRVPATKSAPVRNVLRTAPATAVPAPAPQPMSPSVNDNPAYALPRSPLPPPAGINGARDRQAQRVESERFANPSTTIPQGALINAVLETALDSTRGGQARALVSRDVRGFDGSQVLLPRGSRLIGEYRADLAPGQNRALVQWTRIIRPDGVTMALASPAADTLGRAGIRGRVNSHLLERVTSAILGTAINFGQGAAMRGVLGDAPVIVSVPGGGQEATQAITGGMQIRPTLTVKQGTRVTVFVARDLDFSSTDALP